MDEQGFDLRIYFWSEDVNKAELLTSEVRYLIYIALRDKNIKVK